MKVHLEYGKQGLEVELPDRNLVGVLSMVGAAGIADPVGEIQRALDHPMGTPALAALARGASSACIVFCDITRPVPNALLLPPMLAALEGVGVAREAITLLVATGLHRPSSTDELRLMLGQDILQTYRVVNHRARETAEQRFLGRTHRGTPVYIDRAYCDADLKITTGFIEPHLMAGFSGGRKLIAPGCAGEETIKALHSPQFIEHPSCREGVIEGNPLHEELLEIARRAGHDFMFNVALDAGRRITGVFAGEPVEAHAAGVKHVRRAVGASLRAPADIVVTSGAGYPLDLTLYQAVKGMTAAMPVVKKGGMLVIAAECAEGLGSPEFTEMALQYPNAEAFMATVMEGPVRIDQWQLEECAKVVRNLDVVVVAGGIPEEERRRLFLRSADTVEDAVREGLNRYGPGATIAVIPKGPYTLVSVDPVSGYPAAPL
jgi:lactate racemase